MAYEEQPDDGLTEQERAALSITETDDETTTSETADVNEDQPAAAVAEESAAASGDAPAAVSADGAVDVQPAAAAVVEPEAEAAPAAAKASDVPAQPAAASAPVLIANAPEDAKARLEALETQKADLTQKWEDGDLTGKEFQIELNKLNGEQRDIERQVDRAELAAQMEQQRLSTMWVNDCNAFLAVHPEYRDEARGKLLDDYIRALSQVPSNANLTNAQALEKAHKMVKVDLGEPLETTPAAPAKPAKQAEIPKPAAQPNIGNLPVASMNDTTGGEFAALDRLQKSGKLEEYEEAVERLTEAQRARYLRA